MQKKEEKNNVKSEIFCNPRLGHRGRFLRDSRRDRLLGLEAAITQICPKAMVVPKAIPQGHTNKKNERAITANSSKCIYFLTNNRTSHDGL